jgi:hypothetical protein
MIHSAIGELNSTFGKLSNNLVFGYTYQNEDRGSYGDFFPLVEIQNANSTYITFGFEPFTPNNKLNYTTLQLQDNVTYFAGQHTITAGFNLEKFSFENVFFPGSQSVYVYNTLAEWYTDANDYIANPSRTLSPVSLKRFQLRYSALDGGAEPVQPTKVLYAGAYIQDQYTPFKGMKITAGIRIDVPIFENTGFHNDTVATKSFMNRNGSPVSISTDKLPDPHILFSPRLGFNYDVTGDRKFQVRGGTGLFTGRPAFVWISNQIGNNGVITGFEQTSGTGRPFNPNPKAYIPSAVAFPQSYELAVTDPNFKFPQIWRSNIATDTKLPFDLVGTVEFVYNKEVNGIGYYNANLPSPSTSLLGPDNRPYYQTRRIVDGVAPAHTIVNAVTLDNGNNGYSYSLAASIEKPLYKGFFAKLSYAFGESKNTVDAGSIASGSYNNNLVSWDPNNAPIAYSTNDQRNRFFLMTSYRLEYANAGATQFSFFLEGRNQGRFSYYYSSDLNGDGNTNDLLYIPKDISEMNFDTYTPTGAAAAYTAAQQASDFDAFIKQDDYLNSRRGKYAERNGVLRPWVWSADFSITQDFYMNVGGKRNTLQFALNILNFTNLMNDSWGVYRVVNSTRPVSVRTALGNPALFRMNTLGIGTGGSITKIANTYSKSAGLNDVWSAQFSIRYIFN